MVLGDKEIAYLRELEESSARQASKRKSNAYARFCIVVVALAARRVVLLTWPISYYVADLRSAYNEGDLLLQVVITRMAILFSLVQPIFIRLKTTFIVKPSTPALPLSSWR